MATNKSSGGVWYIKMLRPIGWAGLKAGEVVKVPIRVKDQIALRWVEDGQAEHHTPGAEAKNKMAKKAKATKLIKKG